MRVRQKRVYIVWRPYGYDTCPSPRRLFVAVPACHHQPPVYIYQIVLTRRTCLCVGRRSKDEEGRRITTAGVTVQPSRSIVLVYTYNIIHTRGCTSQLIKMYFIVHNIIFYYIILVYEKKAVLLKLITDMTTDNKMWHYSGVNVDTRKSHYIIGTFIYFHQLKFKFKYFSAS